MKFDNKENPVIIEKGSGKKYFHSRSVAVVAMLSCNMVSNTNSVLIVQRGPDLDNAGKWCLPCGYLDWNETVEEAVIREVYEETNINLNKIILKRGASLKLLDLMSDPEKDKLQNIRAVYGFEFLRSEMLDLDICNKNCPNEIVNHMWWNGKGRPPGGWAFGHHLDASFYIESLNKK